jgi:hypothetical protein
MFRRAAVSQAVALALALPVAAQAEGLTDSISVSGYVKNETAVFTEGGQTTGFARSTIDDREYDGGQLIKFENSARFFLTGDLAENTTWSADINLIYDSEGTPNDYKGYMLYSSHDYLRELYIDTKLADWQFRVGKQQVVWGTADGIKLLDIINPTDWREFNQNTFEDSRIPIWMIKAEKNLTERSNVQFIVSQHEENKIPGLNNEGDWGNPFLFKGIDTITGPVNGFRSIVPPLGRTATAFETMANVFTGGFATSLEAAALPGLTGGGATATVQNYIDGKTPFCPETIPECNPNLNLPDLQLFQIANVERLGGVTAGRVGLVAGAIPQLRDAAGGNNQLVTNAVDDPTRAGDFGGAYDAAKATSAFEYMPLASFATFDTFAGATSRYRKDYPDTWEPNLGARWKNTTAGGFSYSLNYFYAYDPNPSVSIHWEDQNGRELVPYVTSKWTRYVPGIGPGTGIVEVAPGTGDRVDTVRLAYADTGAPFVNNLRATNKPVLVFEETVHRIHNIGGAFDMSIDNLPVPVVVRGELLYQKDTRIPVIDRGEMAIGNLTEALKSERADQFKYVVGVDITVLTNLFVSGQFIQFINLDYIDEESDRVSGYKRYTGDLPVLHLDNQLQKADEYKEFYSLFFSKPFGPSQEHRWNNITIYEEGDGWWNRFDVEYTFTDNLIGSAELNLYWGDENTLFGQFENSSNFQVGLKYIF